MDTDSWAELARLAREAKAELEATEPEALADINACNDVVVVAEAMLADGTWTTDPEVLGEWLDTARTIALAVRNGHEPAEWMYLPLDGADEAQKILRSWLAQAPEGVRRETQVTYGDEGADADTACVTVRERRPRVADATETHGAAEAREPAG